MYLVFENSISRRLYFQEILYQIPPKRHRFNKNLEYNGLQTCRGDRFFSTPLLLYMEKSKNDGRITKPQIYLNPTIETTTLKLRMPLEPIKLHTVKY